LHVVPQINLDLEWARRPYGIARAALLRTFKKLVVDRALYSSSSRRVGLYGSVSTSPSRPGVPPQADRLWLSITEFPIRDTMELPSTRNLSLEVTVESVPRPALDLRFYSFEKTSRSIILGVLGVDVALRAEGLIPPLPEWALALLHRVLPDLRTTSFMRAHESGVSATLGSVIEDGERLVLKLDPRVGWRLYAPTNEWSDSFPRWRRFDVSLLAPLFDVYEYHVADLPYRFALHLPDGLPTELYTAHEYVTVFTDKLFGLLQYVQRTRVLRSRTAGHSLEIADSESIEAAIERVFSQRIRAAYEDQ